MGDVNALGHFQKLADPRGALPVEKLENRTRVTLE
jgi:hypothetical protein